jgi:glycosyltransferase involved in cell wall biosynthesis
MLTIHRLLQTYSKHITTYIALSDFAKSQFIHSGVPEDRIVVKPNFVDPDPGRGTGAGGYCLYVGRLSEEKGIRTLLDAWTRFSPPLPLEIAGDGDMAPEVEKAAAQCDRIRWHGRLQKPQLYERMKNAAALIVPSTWFEPFGIVLIEAFAMGLPVIASKIGAMERMVEHKITGLHFAPGDAADLAAQVSWFHHHPEAVPGMRSQARREFEHRYTGERNYSLLMQIYAQTIPRFGGARPSAAAAAAGGSSLPVSEQVAAGDRV